MTSDVRISKFLSRALRHRPDRIGITLDASGWVDADVLLAACARSGMPITREQLERIVRESDKQRFAWSEDGTRIRASQGHTVEVDLGYASTEPPDLLYHGTVARFLPSIREMGLLRGSRHHVHLSETVDTARQVGQRRGVPVVLVVGAGEMHRAGHLFYKSANGVWLTETVPPQYLQGG